jgi:hypothetical protein
MEVWDAIEAVRGTEHGEHLHIDSIQVFGGRDATHPVDLVHIALPAIFTYCTVMKSTGVPKQFLTVTVAVVVEAVPAPLLHTHVEFCEGVMGQAFSTRQPCHRMCRWPCSCHRPCRLAG